MDQSDLTDLKDKNHILRRKSINRHSYGCTVKLIYTQSQSLVCEVYEMNILDHIRQSKTDRLTKNQRRWRIGDLMGFTEAGSMY